MKPASILIVPTGTLFEPTELSGAQADSGSCPSQSVEEPGQRSKRRPCSSHFSVTETTAQGGRTYHATIEWPASFSRCCPGVSSARRRASYCGPHGLRLPSPSARRRSIWRSRVSVTCKDLAHRIPGEHVAEIIAHVEKWCVFSYKEYPGNQRRHTSSILRREGRP